MRGCWDCTMAQKSLPLPLHCCQREQVYTRTTQYYGHIKLIRKNTSLMHGTEDLDNDACNELSMIMKWHNNKPVYYCVLFTPLFTSLFRWKKHAFIYVKFYGICKPQIHNSMTPTHISSLSEAAFSLSHLLYNTHSVQLLIDISN